eukprot:8306298-Pyramimonas_sp.AAC.1
MAGAASKQHLLRGSSPSIIGFPKASTTRPSVLFPTETPTTYAPAAADRAALESALEELRAENEVMEREQVSANRRRGGGIYPA